MNSTTRFYIIILALLAFGGYALWKKKQTKNKELSGYALWKNDQIENKELSSILQGKWKIDKVFETKEYCMYSEGEITYFGDKKYDEISTIYITDKPSSYSREYTSKYVIKGGVRVKGIIAYNADYWEETPQNCSSSINDVKMDLCNTLFKAGVAKKIGNVELNDFTKISIRKSTKQEIEVAGIDRASNGQVLYRLFRLSDAPDESNITFEVPKQQVDTSKYDELLQELSQQKGGDNLKKEEGKPKKKEIRNSLLDGDL